MKYSIETFLCWFLWRISGISLNKLGCDVTTFNKAANNNSWLMRRSRGLLDVWRQLWRFVGDPVISSEAVHVVTSMRSCAPLGFALHLHTIDFCPVSPRWGLLSCEACDLATAASPATTFFAASAMATNATMCPAAFSSYWETHSDSGHLLSLSHVLFYKQRT